MVKGWDACRGPGKDSSIQCQHWENIRESNYSSHWSPRTGQEQELHESDTVSPFRETEAQGGLAHSPIVHSWPSQGSRLGRLIPKPLILTVMPGTKCRLSLGQAPGSPLPI